MLGRFPALAGADLDVEIGRDRACSSGANGAGKTTLLRLCAGLLPLRSGQAEVLGVDLAGRPPARSGASLALVGHETFCYDDLTVRENMHFATRGRPVTRPPRPTPRSNGSALDPGRATSRTAGSRRASGDGSRSRSRSPAIRGCCCSTSRTPGSTSRAARVLDEVVRAAPAEGRTVLIASHELDLARKLATPRGADRGRAGSRVAARCARPGVPHAHARRPTRDVRARALLVAGKDLRIERRSRVALQQILPFGGIVVVMFAFALDADRTALARPRPGCSGPRCCSPRCSRSAGRSRSRKSNGARDGLRLSGLDGGSIFVGKAAAIAVELFLLEVVLGVGRRRALRRRPCTARSCCVLRGGGRDRRTGGRPVRSTACWRPGCAPATRSCPLLVLPAVTPVMLGATRAFAAALDGSTSEAWQWVQLLAAFSLLAIAAGMTAFGPLLEES